MGQNSIVWAYFIKLSSYTLIDLVECIIIEYRSYVFWLMFFLLSLKLSVASFEVIFGSLSASCCFAS